MKPCAKQNVGQASRLPRPRSGETPARLRRWAGGTPALHARRAFTLIEITIAVAVIGFALVAIIGILPRGLQVQRDNRAETIINQDGTYWLETIRNGAQGLDELVGYVSEIAIVENGNTRKYTGFQTGAEIVGLLTTQAVVTNADVTAKVWALSGAAAEKDPGATDREMAFRYLLRVGIHQSTNSAFTFLDSTTRGFPTNEMLSSLYDLDIELAYPLVRDNQAPARKQSFRAQVSRNVFEYYESRLGATNYFFVP